jgi:hypothetical protein
MRERLPIQDSIAVCPPIAGAGRRQRIDARSRAGVAAAHSPRPHPPVEEPEEQPDEHAPETEPDEGDPDAPGEEPRRPPRPGKSPSGLQRCAIVATALRDRVRRGCATWHG